MEKLTKYVAVLLLLVSTGLAGYAQGGRPGAVQRPTPAMRRPNAGKRIQAIKKGYISQRLALTPEQGAKFWPLYEQYQNEIDEVAKARRENNTDPNAGSEQFEKELGYQQKITTIQKHYYDEFSKALTPEKATQVFKSERDFKVELLLRIKEGKTSEQPDN